MDEKQRPKRIAGIILAAGRSTRMGRPKPLLDLDGKPFVRRVVEAAKAGGLSPLVVVVGPHAEEVRERVEGIPDTNIVVNPNFADGMSSSLVTGLTQVAQVCDAAMILLADQPLLPAFVIQDLCQRYRADWAKGTRIVRARYAGVPGHPVLFDRSLFPELFQLTGDTGAKSILMRHPSRVAWLDVPNPLWGQDVDTPEAYIQLLQAVSRPKTKPCG
ncbi:nucleotidyltransferase family protein [Alicyclobacillus herbarius]|uniref:nucleotidyltransferase family protein n=1 Tax=Alicyclobacillus herbarius TaxID=122960 RepID=UPI0003FEFED1|nr:nucleotidyltransferase family protein [Alicyclobacillus herbarius]